MIMVRARMTRLLPVFLLALSGLTPLLAQPTYRDIEQPPHLYSKRPLKDRFTQLKPAFEAGQLPLDRTSEKGFLISLLRLLGIPASSQMMLFSTTSLQLGLISPRNPRALYFNEDIYLGFIPGGRVEIVSLDPELGGIFYIFDLPRGPGPVRVERSERCMNCHSGDDTGGVPGLLIKSVVPGPTGGSLKAFRIEQSGHQIPLEQRFGGWHVTGADAFTNHWGNMQGRSSPAGLERIPLEPGRLFDFAKYPVATSDVLPQLVHEHQVGFVNRAIEAAYRARTSLFASQGKLSSAQSDEFDAQAKLLARYILFADEAKLPAGGIAGDPAFKTDFLRARRVVGGASLKDFDLRTRLFKHRCSYMIYSPVFTGLPKELKQRVYRDLGTALSVAQPAAEFSYLPAEEKQVIRTILKGTLKDLPKDW
jgi:hypothetical protein